MFIKLVLIEGAQGFGGARPVPAPRPTECTGARQPIPYAETSALPAIMLEDRLGPYWYRHHRLRFPPGWDDVEVVLISE